MGFFTAVTKVVEIDAANRVTIRKLTFEEQQSVISSAMRVEALQNGMTSAVVDAGVMALKQTQLAVVSWEGPGFEGLPANPVNVGRLPAAIGQQLQAAVDALNAGLSDAEKKASGTPTS